LKGLKTIRSVNNFNHKEGSVKTIVHEDLRLSQLPLLQYFVAAAFIGLSAYLIYSVAGGVNGISTFKQSEWWQYILALIPITFACLIVILSPS
jgi:hypothetical protein